MFQFPGFALKDLCIQSMSTCFAIRNAVPEGTDNRSTSGGFPHSDIPGSKGALASPGLIAECHVLHRLLLPRHPPNALLALDPIQKTEDRPLSARRAAARQPPVRRSRSVLLDLERHVTAAQARRLACGTHHALIFTMSNRPAKVLTNMVGVGGLEPPTLRLSGVRSNHLSYTPPASPERGRGPAADARERVVEPDGIEPTT